MTAPESPLALFGTDDLIGEEDRAIRDTVREFAKDKAPALHARTVFVFNPAGLLLARGDQPLAEPKDFSQVPWVADALKMNEVSATIREGKVLAAVAAVPVIFGDMARGEARLGGVIAASWALAFSLTLAFPNTLHGMGERALWASRTSLGLDTAGGVVGPLRPA